MKVIIVLSALSVVVLAQTPSKCGPFPTAKKPTECCENLDKLMKPQLYETCKAQCDQDHCCGATCISNALGFVKDKKFDKVTAKAAISKAFGGDSTWSTIGEKAVDECLADLAASKLQSPGPACPAPELGLVTFCVKKKLFSNCPKPIKDAECEKIRAFMICVGV